MYVESLGPHDFGMVSFVKFGPANQESIGHIRRVSNCLFSVSSYILVLRYYTEYSPSSALPSSGKAPSSGQNPASQPFLFSKSPQ